MEPQSPRAPRRPWTLALACIISGALAGAALMARSGQPLFASTPAPAYVTTSGQAMDLAPFKTGFSSIVKPLLPAVVNISTSKVVKPQQGGGNPMLNDPMFRQFFGDQFGQQFQARPQVEHSLGSGVIVTADGYILTNNHVVDDATDIKVQMGGKQEFKARLVGRDPRTDVAVLKIDAKNLTVMPLGDSSRMDIGDLVFAIGDPYGIGETVTMGIVSAKGRGNLGIEGYEDFLQTDASINPGNSGGALINAQGQCIGINTAILAGGGGGNQGIGFAIPINMARGIMDQLIKNGKVVRGYLGITIQALTPDLAKQFGLSQGGGAVVGDVQPDSPAAKAGIQRYDVVLELNGSPVADNNDLRNRISQTPPGTEVNLKVFRNSKTMDFTLKLGELPEKLAGEVPGESAGKDVLQGVEVETLTADIAGQLNLPAGTVGVVVSSIDPASPAAQAGLTRGDVIQEVNRHPVHNTGEFDAAVKSAGSNSVLLLVNRGGTTSFLVIQPQ
jgi:serine protease Do